MYVQSLFQFLQLAHRKGTCGELASWCNYGCFIGDQAQCTKEECLDSEPGKKAIKIKQVVKVGV